jgi:hypothetical protein
MMGATDPLTVATLGLFERRFAGDDCLMRLANRRFSEAGMGAEMHAGTPEHLEWVMSFRSSSAAPVMVHLPRDFNLADEQSRNRTFDLALKFAGRVSGLVLHDHSLMVEHAADYIEAARKLNAQLEKIPDCPMLFVEYAAGLEPRDFCNFFSSISDLQRIGPCIDIGHVGIRAVRASWARIHQGEDICAFKSQGPRLPSAIAEVETAVASGLPTVLGLADTISALKKPVHYHLHDGHPLSTASAFGVADHLSFLTEIPLNFEYQERRSVAPMFGPAGLAKIVSRAIELAGDRRVSFTLEIHPTGERLQLGDAEPLFKHWTDKTNAEKMNHWLAVLSRNHELLLRSVPASPE